MEYFILENLTGSILSAFRVTGRYRLLCMDGSTFKLNEYSELT